MITGQGPDLKYIVFSWGMLLLGGKHRRCHQKMVTHHKSPVINTGIKIPEEGRKKIIIINFVGLEKTVTELVTGCLRTMKSCYICIRSLVF